MERNSKGQFKNLELKNKTIKGKKIRIGTYKDIEEAIKARKEAEEKYYKPILEKYKEQDT